MVTVRSIRVLPKPPLEARDREQRREDQNWDAKATVDPINLLALGAMITASTPFCFTTMSLGPPRGAFPVDPPPSGPEAPVAASASASSSVKEPRLSLSSKTGGKATRIDGDFGANPHPPRRVRTTDMCRRIRAGPRRKLLGDRRAWFLAETETFRTGPAASAKRVALAREKPLRACRFRGCRSPRRRR